MKYNGIIKAVTKVDIKASTGDVAYWLTRSQSERLAALEQIRREYNDWKYSDAEQRLQRVYRLVKLK